MKKILTLLCVVSLCSCHEDTSLEQLQEIKKPAVVFAKYTDPWESILIIKDVDGNLIYLEDDRFLRALLEKYNIGDTIPLEIIK